ncbi:DNA-binding transcriptional LysR family regulator [Microbacterium sp. SORGH_AS 505]|nr:DNA-binding transcriptional LysR family regulator [Microbacterium sp. SORGH_AS_0505]
MLHRVHDVALYIGVPSSLPDLSVAELRIVKAIGDAGSVTAAAAALGYSQPAVSQQIRRLESRLGIPVVERVGRRMRLTEAGRILARHAASITTALGAVAGELADLSGGRTGTVRLVGFPSASPTVLPRLMRRLSETDPGVSLTYVEAEPPEAVAAVRADRADIALTFSHPGDGTDAHGDSIRGLDARRIGEEDLLLILPEGHPRASDVIVDIETLAADDWIAGCPRCRSHLLDSCSRAGFTPRIRFETDNVAAVEQLVAQRVGVATLPRLAVASFPLVEGILTRPLASRDRRELHAVSARGAARVPAVATVLRHLADAVGDMAASGPEAPGAEVG